GRVDVVLTSDDEPFLNGCSYLAPVDSNGTPINTIGPSCDDDDGSVDGTHTFVGISTGNYAVLIFNQPGYVPLDWIPLHVTNGQTTTVNASLQKTGPLTIKVENPQHSPVKGTCFSVYTDIGPDVFGNQVGFVCDGANADADGVMVFGELAPGNYRLW